MSAIVQRLKCTPSLTSDGRLLAVFCHHSPCGCPTSPSCRYLYASPPPACELLGGGQRGVVVDGADVRGQIAVGMMAKIVSECPDRPVDLHGFVD